MQGGVDSVQRGRRKKGTQAQEYGAKGNDSTSPLVRPMQWQGTIVQQHPSKTKSPFVCLWKFCCFVSVWRQYMASDRNGTAIFMVSATQMHWMQGEALILPTRHVQKWRCLFVVLRLCYLCRHSFLHCIQCHSKKNDTSRVINSHWDISCIFVVYPQYSGHNQMVSTLVVLIYKGVDEKIQQQQLRRFTIPAYW